MGAHKFGLKLNPKKSQVKVMGNHHLLSTLNNSKNLPHKLQYLMVTLLNIAQQSRISEFLWIMV